MIDRNADIPRTTKSIFLEEIAKVRSVYEAHPPVNCSYAFVMGQMSFPWRRSHQVGQRRKAIVCGFAKVYTITK